jgi:hypothetical protein
MLARAYDHDGNRRIEIEIQRGDQVEWKRNGTTGSFRAEFLGAVGQRLQLARIKLLDSEREVNVKPRFLSIWREGKRLP